MPTKTKKTSVSSSLKKRSKKTGGKIRLFDLEDSDCVWLVAVLPDLTASAIGFWYCDELDAVDASSPCVQLAKLMGAPISSDVAKVDVYDFFQSLKGEDDGEMTYKGRHFDSESDVLFAALKDRKFVSAMVRGRALPVN